MLIFILKKIFAVMMAVLCVFTSPMLGDFAAKFEPKDKEKIELNFATISDVHMTDGVLRKFMLKLGLSDMENASSPLDALILAGDITNHGYEEHWEAVADCFSKYKPAKNILLTIGNHDTWTRSENISFTEMFCKYNSIISNREISKPYYSTKINGYTFVSLGSESDLTAAYISDEQIQWLKDTMNEAAKDNKPIFVICHQPFNGTHGLPERWGNDEQKPDDGGMGEQSDEVEAILKQYKNVFLISGHVHNGITNDSTAKIYGYSSIENEGSFHSINLPCYMYMVLSGVFINGLGYQFEVYSDKVVIRARSYSASVWYTKYEETIPLV